MEICTNAVIDVDIETWRRARTQSLDIEADIDIEMHGEKEISMQPERAASPNTDGTLATPLT